MGIQWQRVCEDIRVKDWRALSARAVVRHDVQLVRARLDGHAGELQIASLIVARQKDLPDRYAVAIKDQGAALSVHRQVNTSVAVEPNGIGRRAGEVIRNRCADRRNLPRTFEINVMEVVFTELRRP